MSIVYIGDLVQVHDFIPRVGVVINCNSDRSLIRHESNALKGQYDDIWYPNDMISPIKRPEPEKQMEDTREYLQSITGET